MFIDYEKAFDDLDQQSIWKLLRHFGVPEKITSIIRNSYRGKTCRVVCGRQLTDAFQVKDRSDTRMLAVALPVSTRHRLDVEGIHSPEEKLNSVDSLDPV